MAMKTKGPSISAHAHQGHVITPADAPRVTAGGHHQYRALQHRSMVAPMRLLVGIINTYTQRTWKRMRWVWARMCVDVCLDPDHASLFGAPTPAPSPSSRRNTVHDYVDEDGDAYGNEGGR